MTGGIEPIFRPRSIAVIGASRDPDAIGSQILHNLVTHGFNGPVYPVNPKTTVIHSMVAYPSIAEVPGDVDLALVVVPAPIVLPVLEACGRKGVRAAVIITAGFKETGPEGAARELELVECARRYGMRIVGPNCLGVLNTEAAVRMDATFAPAYPPQGSVAFSSQSGALGLAILQYALDLKIGISQFVSVGNKADVSSNDLLEFWENDPGTSLVLLYLESFGNPRRFNETARRVGRKKPIVAVKSGRTSAGSRAASSHTGSLAGADVAVDALCVQSGIIRTDTIDEMFDVAMLLANQPVPRGNRVGIVTNAGGPGIIAADAVERSAVRMAQLAKETVDRLREKLPPTAALYNPVDVVGDAKPDRYDAALQNTLSDPHVDAALVILTPQAVTEPVATAVVIKRAAATTQKPILASFVGGPRVAEGTKMLMMAGIPSYSFPERMVSTIEAMYNYKVWRDKPKSPPFDCTRQKGKVAELLAKARKSGRLELGESEARDVVTAYGFQVPKSILARTTVEAIVAGEEVGYPLVMKIASPDILHKSDIGGVKVGIQDPSETRRTFVAMMDNARRRMPEAEIWGVLVQQMVSGGKEVILGMNRDPQFGPMIMFGLGGIYVEALKDVSFRIAPLSPEDAEEMIREIHSYALLRGVRGEKPVNFDAIKESLLRLSLLVTDFPEILELDINPLKVFSNGQAAVAIDARLTVAQA